MSNSWNNYSYLKTSEFTVELILFKGMFFGQGKFLCITIWVTPKTWHNLPIFEFQVFFDNMSTKFILSFSLMLSLSTVIYTEM